MRTAVSHPFVEVELPHTRDEFALCGGFIGRAPEVMTVISAERKRLNSRWDDGGDAWPTDICLGGCCLDTLVGGWEAGQMQSNLNQCIAKRRVYT